MKKLLFIFLFIPLVLFGQQKVAKQVKGQISIIDSTIVYDNPPVSFSGNQIPSMIAVQNLDVISISDTIFFETDTISSITVHNADSVSITINGNVYKLRK